MKSFRQLSFAVVLALALSITALAGDIGSPGITGDILTPGMAGNISTPGIAGDVGFPRSRETFIYRDWFRSSSRRWASKRSSFSVQGETSFTKLAGCRSASRT